MVLTEAPLSFLILIVTVALAAHGGADVVEVVADLFVVRHGGVPSRWVCEGRVLLKPELSIPGEERASGM